MSKLKIMLYHLFLFAQIALKGQTIFHHTEIELNIPTTVQAGYEIQLKKAGFVAHYGIVTQQSVNFLLDLQSQQDPSVQQRNEFLKTGITNSTAFDIALKYYFKASPNSFYISALGQFPSFRFSATAGDYVKNLGIGNGNALDNAIIETQFTLPLLGVTVGKRFKIWKGLAVQTALGASYIIKQNPSLSLETKSPLQENLKSLIQTKMQDAIAESQRTSVLPTLKAGISYTF
jgi:hypothetical protein